MPSRVDYSEKFAASFLSSTFSLTYIEHMHGSVVCTKEKPKGTNIYMPGVQIEPLSPSLT